MLRLRNLVLLWCLFVVSAASARDLVVERSWFEDPTGLMSFAEAQNAPFQSFNGILARGYSGGVIWVRLKSEAREVSGQGWGEAFNILRIRPTYLDDVQVYDSLEPSAPIAVLGDRTHPRSRALRTLDLAAPVTHPEIGRVFYLRMQTTSTRALYVELMSEAEYTGFSQRQNTIFSVLLTFSLIFFLWGVIQFAIWRDPLHGVFSLKQLNALVLGGSILGQLVLFWPDDAPIQWLDNATTLGACLGVSLGILFELIFLSELGISRASKYLLVGFLLLLPVELALVLQGSGSLAVFINMIQLLVAPALLLLIAVRARGWRAGATQRPPLPRAMVLTYYAILMVPTLLTAAPGLGLGPGNEWSIYASMAYSTFSGGFMFAMLLYRRAVLGRRDAELAVKLAFSERQTEVERQHSSEKAKLITVLSHELNTPLSVVRMLIDSATFRLESLPKIESAISDMVQVIARCAMTERAESGGIKVEETDVIVPALVRRVIADTPHAARINLRSDAMACVRTDAQILRVIVTNMIDNALKYSPPATSIRVDISTNRVSDRRTIEILVENEPGDVGFPDPAQVFTKFYRSPSAKRISGSGLGLYIIHELAQRIGGDVDYAPTPTRVGFVLSLRVPEGKPCSR